MVGRISGEIDEIPECDEQIELAYKLDPDNPAIVRNPQHKFHELVLSTTATAAVNIWSAGLIETPGSLDVVQEDNHDPCFALRLPLNCLRPHYYYHRVYFLCASLLSQITRCLQAFFLQ